jgi:hypothetical protein
MIGTGSLNNVPTAALYPKDTNWIWSFNPQLMLTNEALKKSAATTLAPASDSYINIISWKAYKHQPVETASGIHQNSSGGWQINQFYQVEYSMSHIAGFEELYIYRRKNGPTFKNLINTYYQFSRWEKVTITATNTSSTTVKVMLRPPASRYEYDPIYGYTNPAYKRVLKSPYQNYVRYYPVTEPYDEYIFVVKANGSVSTKAVFIKGGPAPGLGQGGFIDYSENLPIVGLWPDILGVESPAGWEKAIADAREPVDVALLYPQLSLSTPLPNALPTLTNPTLTSLGIGPY